MTQAKCIYEQVEQSGLYRLAGTMIHGRFVQATGQRPLRTLRQWQAVQAPLPTEKNGRWRCPQCLTLLPVSLDETGQHKPCSSCGYNPTVGPQHVPADDQFTTFAAPDTMARVIALQQHPHLVSEAHPVPVQSLPGGPPRKRETYAFAGSWSDRFLTYQVEHGMRPAPDAPLRTMDVQRCTRCGKPDRRLCACPPPAPDVGALVVQKQARALEVREQAFVDAGYERIRKV